MALEVRRKGDDTAARGKVAVLLAIAVRDVDVPRPAADPSSASGGVPERTR